MLDNETYAKIAVAERKQTPRIVREVLLKICEATGVDAGELKEIDDEIKAALKEFSSK